IDTARNVLLDVCRSIINGKPVYRFGKDHKGNLKDFTPELINLALLGYTLYVQLLLPETNPDFETQLRNELADPQKVIQVAATNSARYIIPWALVYDHPLVEGNNRVCPQFLKEVQDKAFQGVPSCILK